MIIRPLKYGILLGCFIVVLFNNLSGQDNNVNETHPISFETTYIGDAVYNFSGGIKTGKAYMGYIDLGATINTEGLGIWKNGELFVNVQNTHGSTVSADYIGDAQIVSNIDNGDYTYLYQLWYRQTINKLSLLLGIHDLNSEFFVSDFSGEYVNSSFGIMPAVSANVPVPIFPKTTLGAVLQYNFSETVTFQAAVYDGDPLDLDSVPYNGELIIGDNHGLFSVAELHFKLGGSNERNGTYKIGFFHHSGDFENLVDDKVYKGNYGMYLFIDQMLFHSSSEGSRGLGAFFQLGYSPEDRSLNDLFIAFGLNYYVNQDNIIGLGVAHASLSNKLVKSSPEIFTNSETAIECFYKMKLGEYITLQPEIQYIINPGFDKSLDNALVGLFRTYFEF